MTDFEPSPRATKRRRTGTYATRRRTLASSPTKATDEPPQSSRTSRQGTKNAKDTEQTSDIGDEVEEEEQPVTQQFGTPEEEEQSDGATLRTGRRGRKSTQEQTLDSRPKTKRKVKNSLEVDLETQQPTEEEGNTISKPASGRQRRSLRRNDPLANEQSRRKIGSRNLADAPPSVSSPQPKGILTPSRHGRGQRTGARKSVVFDDEIGIVDDEGDDQVEEQLGFKDIDSSVKKRKQDAASRATEDGEDEIFEDATEYPETGFDSDVIGDEDEVSMWDDDMATTTSLVPVPQAIEDEDPLLTQLKVQVLSRVTNCSHAPKSQSSHVPPYLSSQYKSLHSLLAATVTAGESNSLLLLGSRGSGKTLLVETALSDLQGGSNAEDFHVVRLNGFFQTDDKLALREIWRQLGREMAVPEDETGEVSSYADTMASLLSLLSHPEEFGDPDGDAAVHVDDDTTNGRQQNKKTSKSVVFILDEFDLFTTHPRQTLLYNLLDIAQAKKAPIAVVGCSTRMDVVECLEKRVKSRFSHRWLHIPAAKSLLAFQETVISILSLAVDGKDALGVPADELAIREAWNKTIKALFVSGSPMQVVAAKIFYSTKSIADLLTALYIPIATMALPADDEFNIHDEKGGQSALAVTMDEAMTNSPSLLGLLPHLPTLHLSLLICAARLETVYDMTVMNFALVHKQYTELLTRSKLQQTSSSLSSLTKGGGSLTGAGLRAWNKNTARSAWEDLTQWGLIVPVSGSTGAIAGRGRTGDEGLSGDGIVTKMFRVDVTLDEVAWAIRQKLGTAGPGETLTKWCKEI